MNNNWLLKTTVLSLFAFQLHVDANWKSKNYNKSNKNDESKSMPLGMYHYDDRGAFIKADYLFWYPQQEDVFYAAKATQPAGNQRTINVSYKQPEFGLSSGVRLGIGGFNSDRWDIGLTGMYIYSEGTSRSGSQGNIGNGSTGADASGGSIIVPDFDPFLFRLITQSKVRLQINHFVADFTMGREFFLTRRFSIHPLIGVRGFGIYEHLVATYTGRTDEVGGVSNPSGGTGPTGTISTQQPQYFRAHNDLYGVGPRGGLDLAFYFNEHFSILGGISGSFLLSRYHVHQKYQVLTAKDTSTATQASGFYQNSLFKTKDTGLMLRTNLDGYFGFGWENWYNNDKNRFHFALLCEASEWFGINQLNDSLLIIDDNGNNNNNGGGGNGGAVPDLRRHGDLGYLGGTVRFQFDF
jgi:hypothetical protein